MGADVVYMLRPRFGLGGFVRFTGGSVGTYSGSDGDSPTVGGFQSGGRSSFSVLSSAIRQVGSVPTNDQRDTPQHGPRDPSITGIQRELFEPGRSKAQRYADLVVGKPGFWALFQARGDRYAVQQPARRTRAVLAVKAISPSLLGATGHNVTFGANVVLRQPHKIRIGCDVFVDDGCCLDAKGSDNEGITIGDGVFIGRNVILSCKNGDIILDDHANIGFNSEIFSASRVRLGKNVLVAAYTYLVGGDHLYDRVDIPVLHQGRTAKGIDVDDNAWLGAHVVISDGSHIGRDAIIGAGAVVIGDIPSYHIAAGVPARVIRDRRAPRRYTRIGGLSARCRRRSTAEA